MSQVNRTPSSRRLNPRAAIILGVGSVVLVASFFGYKAYRQRHSRALFLREANARLDAKDGRLALQYLNQYLALSPDDIDALDLKAKILADSVRSSLQALDAMPIHNQVLGRDPDNPKRQETRRRLVELNLKAGGRARAAETLARELIRRGASDAQAHRLLAMALEGVGAEGSDKALAEACREYETAAQIEPGDVDGAERLALLYRDKLNDPKKAEAVLDRLVAANRAEPAKLAAAYLARSRHLYSAGQFDAADAEIGKAMAADSKSVDVLLAAAEAANRRGDAAAARRHLAAIPKDARADLRVKLVEGQVELGEQRADAAIQSWRDGLLQAGGTSAELTWRLAQVLLDIGRPHEAEPLIAQYRRLIGGDEPNVFSRYLSGFALFKQDRPAEAAAELEKIRYKAPKNLEPHVDYVLGQCYERLGDTLKAIDAYRQATKAMPRWSTPWVAIANLQAAEHIDDAYRTIEQGLAASPNDSRLLVNSALIQWREQLRLPPDQRSWADVEQTLGRAEQADPNLVETALLRADYLTTVGKPDAALARLEAVAKLNPNSAPLWLARVNLMSRLGRSDNAQKTLDRAIATSPHAAYFVLRAQTLLGLGHVKEARAALDDGLTRVPAEERWTIWKALGELAAKQGDLVAARHAYGEWVRLRPDSPEPRAAQLELAMNAGDAAAIRAAVDGLKGIGGPKAPYWRLARVEELLRGTNVDAKQLDEAATLIQEAETLQPFSPSGYLLEGRLMEKRGQVDKAIAAYEKALEQRGGRVALAPLLALLARERRDADLERIRAKLPAVPAEIDRLATVQALRAGDKDRAQQLAARMVEGDPQGLDARVWQARVLNELGKPKEAEATLRKLIQQHPGEATPWIQLLMLQVSQKQQEAAATVEEIRRQVKTDKPELLWAQCYRVVGNLAKADASYRDALKRWPNDVAVGTAAVAYFEQTGRRHEAEAVLRQLHKTDPALGWATRKLALLLAGRTGDLDAWNEALTLVGPTARPDDTPDDRLARATVYSQGPEPAHRQQALVILEELASELPGAANIHMLLARLLRDAGKLDQAREHAAKAADGPSATPEALVLSIGILIAEKSLDEAQKQLDRLLAISPDSLAAAELRARILLARGNAAEAADGLERAFAARADTPEGPAVGEAMIGLLQKLDQPEAAARVARKVGATGPRGLCIEGIYLAGRGKLDEAAAKLDEAAGKGERTTAGTSALLLASQPGADARWTPLADRLLTQALKDRPDSIDLLQKVARLRYLEGRFPEQIAAYQKMIDLKPGDPTFMNDMAWTLSEDLHQPEQALPRIDEVLQRVGRLPNFLDTRGVILTRLGKFDEAISDLEAAAAAQPSGPIYFHLARAYHERGRQDDFQKARDRAKQAGLRPERLQPSERAEWGKVMEP